MNRVELRGGLVKDIVFEGAKASFTMAVNGTRFDSQAREQVVKTAFVSCEAWGIVAEALRHAGVMQGCELYVVGELTQFKKEGEERSHTRVAVFTVQVVRMSARSQGAPPPEEPPQAEEKAVENPWGT